MLFTQLASLTVLLPFLLVLKFYRRLSPQLKIFGWFIGISLLTEILIIFLSANDIRTNPIIHVFTVLEFSLLALVIQKSISQIIPGKWLGIIIFLFIVFEIVNTILWQSLDSFNNNTISLSSFLLIIFSLLFYYQIIQKLNVDFLLKEPVFWIVTGIIFYFSANLFFFLALEYLDNAGNTKLFREIWIYLHLLPLIFRNLLFTIGLWNIQTK